MTTWTCTFQQCPRQSTRATTAVATPAERAHAARDLWLATTRRRARAATTTTATRRARARARAREAALRTTRRRRRMTARQRATLPRLGLPRLQPRLPQQQQQQQQQQQRPRERHRRPLQTYVTYKAWRNHLTQKTAQEEDGDEEPNLKDLRKGVAGLIQVENPNAPKKLAPGTKVELSRRERYLKRAIK